MYRLALAFGIWDVDGMLQRMSASQFAGWAAYFRSLGGASKEQRYVGSGQMRVSDWRRMSEAERKKAKSQLYGMLARAVGAKEKKK